MRILGVVLSLVVLAAGPVAAQDGATPLNESRLPAGVPDGVGGPKVLTTPQPPAEEFARNCHRVVADGYWQGRWAHVGGLMCYNAYGEGAVPPDTVHLLYYYPDGQRTPPPQFAPSSPPLQTLPPGRRGFDARDALGMLGAMGVTFAIAGGGGC